MGPETEMHYDNKKFWMIVGDGNTPKVRHTCIHRARIELKRLAETNPGRTFYLLVATESAVKSDVVITKL